MALTVSLDDIVASGNSLLAIKPQWQRVRLGDVGQVLNGYAFKAELFTREGGMPLIRIRDVGSAASETFYSGEFDERYVVSAGDLLVGMDGDFNCARWCGPRSLLNQRVCKITVDEALYLPRFLDYVLPGYLKAINDATSSITVKHLSSRTIQDIPLPLPPMDEQREIVAELEKQFSRLDEAVANLQRVKSNLKRYKASVLKAAVEGRLVETEATLARLEGRTYETGEQLMQRILMSRPSAWKGKYDSPTPPECPDDAVTPDGWTWITVSQAMRERIVNGLSIKESATPTSVRALKLSAMSDQGLDFDDFRWLPIELSKVEDIVIRESDFFVSRGNGSLELVGRGSPAQGPKQAVIFPDTMMRIRFSQVVNVGPWFHALWTTRLVRTQIEKRVKTTAGIYKMAQPELASITVPLPPLAEQARIVAEVDRHLSIIREVEAEVDANLKRAQALRQSVLSRWFKNSAN